ncbi:sugar ABC transporter permease [Peptacetobacter hominis]|uniref:Sugar ABC transporter permease n=1 Tax=Peptacetobacter hominis TaxID=2743610 RepID=A0A544QW61_9FIRM|nr:sugar ABC transporter permease [Peptacetobacter hominis]TQQ84922.1 sugar ABC transporter permease [Peptacetobacter hominis]
MKKKEKQLYLWLIPMVIFLAGFVLAPLIVTIKDSFFSVSLLNMNDKEFVGMVNYINLFKDRNVIKAFSNTSFYLITALIAETLLGLIFAYILKEKFKGHGIAVAILILPWALPPLVNGIMWKLIFDPSIGMINTFLMKLGIISDAIIWLNNPKLSKICIILVHVWRMVPLITIIFMAKMKSIPKEVFEAATIDGASKIKQFFTIILPSVRSVFIITLVQGCIGAFHLFDEAYSMTGIAYDTRSLLIQNYLTAFREYDLGKGMALSLVISFSLIVVMIILNFIVRRSVDD